MMTSYLSTAALVHRVSDHVSYGFSEEAASAHQPGLSRQTETGTCLSVQTCSWMASQIVPTSPIGYVIGRGDGIHLKHKLSAHEPGSLTITVLCGMCAEDIRLLPPPSPYSYPTPVGFGCSWATLESNSCIHCSESQTMDPHR